MDWYKIIIIYVVIVNIIGFLLMGIDKGRAKMKQWRIKEKNLFLIALIGGSFGSIIGMQFFRHKTKHIKFTLGMPIILLLHLGILVFSISYRYRLGI